MPRDAATLILVRNTIQSSGSFEILLLRRHVKSEFMPDAYVFPGGSLEEADYDKQVELICSGLDFRQAQNIITDAIPPDKALGFYVAAIRETFEEAGIILVDSKIKAVSSLGDRERTSLNQYRKHFRKASFSFISTIKECGLKLAVGDLYYFAHWITPDISPVRFDTRFFVAIAPQDQEAVRDEAEVTDHIWITPQRAIEKQSKDFTLHFPTLSNIEELARFSGIDELINSTLNKKVPTIAPKVITEDGKTSIQI